VRVTVNVPDRLAAQARAWSALKVYIEEMLVKQVIRPAHESNRKSVGEPIERIRELRKQNTLGEDKSQLTSGK